MHGMGLNNKDMTPEEIKNDLFGAIGKICLEYNANKLANTYSDYETDEDGNLISCCGDILDEDVMICKTCGEHN